MAKTRPIAQRDTTLHSPDEIKRRAVFVLYALAIPAGGFALIAGIVRHHPGLIVAGVLAFALFVALHFTRRRWKMKDLADEIAKNPFKPVRVPKDPNTGLF